MAAGVNGPAVRADDDRTPKPAAPAPALKEPASAAPRQPQPGWPSLQELLTLPAWMALDVAFTTEPMGGVTPGLAAAGSAAWIQQLVIGADFSSGLAKSIDTWSEADHWQLSTEISSFSGNPNLNLELGTAFPLQTAAHPVGLWLTEATIQRNRGNGPLEVKGGLLALNPSFLDSPSFDSYIHSAINNTLNLLIPGLPINPFVAPGAEVRWHTSETSEIRVGSYWLDSQTALASILGVNPVQPDVRGTLQIVQWTTSQVPGSRSMAGAIHSNRGTIARQLPDPVLQLGGFTTTASSDLYPAGANQGLYGNLTLPVPLPIGLDNRVWLAVSNGFNSDANPFPLFVAGGWLNQGVIPGRPFDVLALGFGRTSFSPQLTPGSYEAVVELNYAITINAQLSVQPVIQWIINPGGGGSGTGSYAGGVQINLSL